MNNFDEYQKGKEAVSPRSTALNAIPLIKCRRPDQNVVDAAGRVNVEMAKCRPRKTFPFSSRDSTPLQVLRQVKNGLVKLAIR